MAYNVPDDWNTFYRACGGHDSNGGCDCGTGDPAEYSNRPWLKGSGYEYEEEDGLWVKWISRSYHTARRDHKDGKVLKGMKYLLVTHRVICDETGDSWIHKKKYVQRVGKHSSPYVSI